MSIQTADVDTGLSRLASDLWRLSLAAVLWVLLETVAVLAWVFAGREVWVGLGEVIGWVMDRRPVEKLP